MDVNEASGTTSRKTVMARASYRTTPGAGALPPPFPASVFLALPARTATPAP
ncbi:hypothetical protein [Streptomyces sp. NPDC005805]|uniref:hypothetical protein n=1 Tax=Streptomyces sp. NPDC005805 TaxID=3157068 RepID=UPI00340CD154